MKKIITVLSLLFFVALAEANLSVTPSRVDIRIANNDTISSSFTVTNNYDGDIDLEITTKDWNSYKGNGELNVDSWFIFSEKNIHLKKGEAREIPYTIKTDSSMKGSVAGQVTFSLNPPGNEGVTVKMSFPVYLIIYGTEKIKFDIAKISFNQLTGDELKLAVLVKNSGNVHVRPSAILSIYNKKNEIVYTTALAEGAPVYAETERAIFNTSIHNLKNYEPGTYTIEIVVKALGESVTKKVKFKLKSDGTITQ